MIFVLVVVLVVRCSVYIRTEYVNVKVDLLVMILWIRHDGAVLNRNKQLCAKTLKSQDWVLKWLYYSQI